MYPLALVSATAFRLSGGSKWPGVPKHSGTRTDVATVLKVKTRLLIFVAMRFCF
jgi:hypothetical protein